MKNISLKTRIRYEGGAQIFDRRAVKGADLEKLPEPMRWLVGLSMRKFGEKSE